MDLSKLSNTPIDPKGKYVKTTRCRTGRAVRGYRLPTCNSFEERRELERIIVQGLKALDGELKGEYRGLYGSTSVDVIGEKALTFAEQQGYRKNGHLFQDPDSTLLLSTGCARHWPDARGFFYNNQKNFFVWLNEEDHMRIVSMEQGDDVKAVFKRFVQATTTIEKILKQHGKAFMHSEHLGYIHTCPSNLGTGLRAGAHVKLPLFGKRKDYKKILGAMALSARGKGGVDDTGGNSEGILDISNAERLGKSEVQLVNYFIEGVSQVIKWEQMLEKGESIEEEINKKLANPINKLVFK